MNIKEAQELVDEMIQIYGGYWEPLSMMARLTEETGELARAMNQEYGGKRKKTEEDGNPIKDELGDVLFTCLAIAHSQGIDAGEALLQKMKRDNPSISKLYSSENDKPKVERD